MREGRSFRSFLPLVAAVSLVLVLFLAVRGDLVSGPAPRAVEPSPLAVTPAWPLSLASPPQGMALDFRGYPAHEAILEFSRQLEERYPDLVQLEEAGKSVQGRPILVLRLGNESNGDPDQRPALELDGQHHAREPIGQQVLLYTAWHLASSYGRDPLSTHLLDTRTLYLVPCVNPDGNEAFLDEYWGQRKNLSATDDDGDGRHDEDPVDGASGWSVFQVWEIRFGEAWLEAHPADPFAAGWEQHCSGRELGYYDEATGALRPQVDNDQDGQVNEDPSGGVDLNRNYPAGWDRCSRDPASLTYRGPEPWSEPEVRAVRSVVEAHPNIRLAVSYHSGDDRLAISGLEEGRLPADAPLFERAGVKASWLTEAYGYAGTRHQYGSGLAPGETRAWLYQRGILSWLVEAYSKPGVIKWRWVDRGHRTAWAYYHTGLRFNPPPDGILDSCRRWLSWNLYLLAAVPCPAVARPAVDGAALRAVVHNDGLVPVDCEVSLSLSASGETMALGSVRLPRLGPTGYELRWWLDADALRLLDDGALLDLKLDASGPSLEYPAPALCGRWQWRVDAQGSAAPVLREVSVSGPPSGDFLDLGAAFGPGGWDAPPGPWDSDRYHLATGVRPAVEVP